MSKSRPPPSATLSRDPTSTYSEERAYRLRNNPGSQGMGGYTGRSASMASDAADGAPHHPDAVGLHELRERWRRDAIEHRRAIDPDYARWREDRERDFDADYEAWRQERYRRFSDEFGAWRRARAGKDRSSG